MEENTPIHTPNYTKIVLGGGGVKGTAYIGVLEYLQKENLIENFTEFVGCSIGSLFSLLFMLNIDYKYLRNYILKLDIESLVSIKIMNFISHYGLDSGEGLESIIKHFLTLKGIDENITLLELYSLTNKLLTVTTANVNKRCTEFINKDNYPNLKVVTALKMSMCVPYLFHPVKVNGCLYVDGGITCDLPINFYLDHTDVLSFTFHKQQEHREINSLFDYLYNLTKAASTILEEQNKKKAENLNLIFIKTDINFLQLNINEKQKKKLINSGFKSTASFFSFFEKSLK